MGSNFLSDLRAAGAALFSHDRRLIKLRFAERSGIAPGTLLPQAVSGREALSQCYRYQLDCLSADAYLELKQFFGQPIEISLLLPDGGQRLLTGLVTQAEATGADGGFSTWRLTVEPALATLAHRRNSRVFQKKSVIEIVSAILDEHLAANPAFTASFGYESRAARSYPQRSYCLQYRETDLTFIERLLREEGISYRFTHGPDAEHSIRSGDAGGDNADDTPLHTLILFDADSTHPQASTDVFTFHRTDGVETQDAIDTWEGSRQLQSGSSSLNTFDYQTVSQDPAASDQYTRQGDAGADLTSSLESYDPQTLYYGSDPDDMERYATLRQQAKDFASKAFSGAGTTRALEVGTWFELRDHPVHDQDDSEDRQFLVTGLDFEARNNLLPDDPPGLGSLLAANDGAQQSQPPYRNTFTAVRRHIAVVPEYEATGHQKPKAPGCTTATVVGPASEEIYTDEHGRIKVQFHWQRPQDHPEGGADFDERSSTWVRVAYPSAGAQWGTQYIPRIGQEVLIDFIEGDIDRPIVTGVVYNGTHRPPIFSGAGKLPANKTLSGVKTKEYKGGAYNELLFDDTTGELRAKLSSEHGKTQLNQGYLIHPRREGKGQPRGEGYELRTDETGALRAAKGILLSAEPRGQAVGNQLDRDMLLGQLQSAEGIAKFLSDLSDKHGAEKTETEPQTQLLKDIENWEKGSNTASKENAAEGGKPIIALSGPQGIVAGTPESFTLTTGNNIDLVSVKHTNLSVGGKWLARVADSFSLFVHKLGMKLIAAGGHIDIQAQDGEIRISAAKRIILTSNEEIIYQAPKVTAIAQGAQINMGSGSITTQCQGAHTQKAAQHHLTGPGGGSPKGAFDPKKADFDQKAVLKWMGTGAPIKNRAYRLKLEDGRVLEGVTNDQGHTQQFQSEIGFARYRIELLPEA